MKRPQEKQSKYSGFGLIGLLIAVAVIGLLAGGGLYFREGQERKSQIQMGLEAERRAEELRDKILRQQKQQLEETGEKPETQQPSSPDTTSWKTYRNEKYGFEVRYPPQWIIIPTSRSGEINGFEFRPKDNRDTNSLFTIYVKNRPGVFGPEGIGGLVAGYKVEIHGFDFMNAKKPCNTCQSSINFIFEKDKTPEGWPVYGAGFDLDARNDSEKQVLSQILSTFKFTK